MNKTVLKIVSLTMMLALLCTMFIMPVNAADASATASVRLEKVVGMADYKGNLSEDNNIYKAVVSIDSTNPLTQIMLGLSYDSTVLSPRMMSSSGSIAWQRAASDGGNVAYSKLGNLADTNMYNDLGEVVEDEFDMMACGPSYASSGSTFASNLPDTSTEVYSTWITRNGYAASGTNYRVVFAQYSPNSNSTACTLMPEIGEDMFEFYFQATGDLDGTEIKVAIDVAYDTNPTKYGSKLFYHGANSTNTSFAVVNNGSYTYDVPSPVYAKTSQVRYNSAETNGKGSANFDVRTRAALSVDDFNALCTYDAATKVTNIEKVGFVYADSTVGMTLENAAKVIGGTEVAGYVDVPVEHIQIKDGEYIWTCLIEDAAYEDAVDSVGYIVVDGTTYYFDAVYATDFSTLYGQQSSHIPTA